MANNVDPDQNQPSATSDLGLHGLQRPICPNTLGYYGICTKGKKDFFYFQNIYRLSGAQRTCNV